MKYISNENTQNIEVQISPEEIAGYIMLRSLSDRNKFNIFAVNSKDELLFAAATDLDFEKASALVEAINGEHYPHVLSPTELVEVELAGEKRIFSVKKG